MADDAPDASPKTEPLNVDVNEDAETRAARRELKQSSISDPPPAGADDTTARPDTPADNLAEVADTSDLKDQVASPKKKRAHDQLDGEKETDENDANSVASTDSAKDRASRLEPEKKRHRDEESNEPDLVPTATDEKSEVSKSPTKKHQPHTSASAFASSSFGKLSSDASPFATFGGASKGASVFGSSGTATLTSFASPSAAPAAQLAAAPKLTFGGATGASPFAGLSSATNGFGSTLGGSAFGSALSGIKPLGSFAAPGGDAPKNEKPAKPFGAPDSDAEESDDEGSANEDAQPEEAERAQSPEKESEEKKKLKLQKVEVNDGEAGETTIVSVRAKMFYHDKEAGWKERGAGMLKINVPQVCVEFDDAGAVIPGSFDASSLETNDNPGDSNGHRVARLLLRQDQTHRVILNTAILPATVFQEKASLKSVGILFTAFEGEPAKPVSITMRVCAYTWEDSNRFNFGLRQGGASASHVIWRQFRDQLVSDHIATLTLHVYLSTRTAWQRPDSPKTISASWTTHEDDLALGKRKRASDQKASTRGSGDESTSAAEANKGGKRGKSKPHGQTTASNIVACLIDWPESFKTLEQTHKALNLVFTFCCTRKHLATTFDTIKSSVEAQTKRGLSIEEVASIVALRPESINFAYVDEVMLQLDVRGIERDEVFRTGKSARSQVPAFDASVGGLTGTQGVGCSGKSGSSGREVLYFEFVDGDLKRQVPDKTSGEPTRPNRKLRDEQLRMPVYSQKQMTTLIEKRNQKFTNSVNIFLNKCVEEKLDPTMALAEQTKSHIPNPTVLEDDTTEKPLDSIPESIPKERKSIPEIVQELKDSPWYTGQVVPDGHRVFEPQEAIFGDLQFLLSQDLVNALYNAKGITQFFAHQSEALNSLYEGKNVVVSTSTSSGKSLIYQLPILYALEKDYLSRAMYIFPTKALAQDQKRSLKEMMRYMPGLEDVMVATFDGDTPMGERNAIRDEARIIFTNPDMLHVTILPQEERWRTYLKNLKYVVVDELHYYNGQMGSHVAFIMRRLRRVCAAVGNRRVRFISCSATVANPKEHFKTIFGLDNVRLIDFDGSPSGRKEFLCWNTPFKDPGDPASGRGSAKFECARLFCALMLRGVRIIAFCRVRAQCETLVSTIKSELETMGRSECINRVMGYRGGYTAQDRRRIETEMFEGKLLGIVATTALELGIDIGSLDCVMTWGFPYTIANLRQQSGRAGRRNKDSLSILVGDCFPTDQHYMQNPDELFTKPNSALQVDLENMLVREGHVQCAAYEMPIRPREDAQYFGEDLPKICDERLTKDEMGFYHCHDRFRPMPAKFVAIRDTEDEHFAIVDITHGRNVVLEELEASRATFTIYDGAIFLHQGNSYLVRDFLPDKRMAKVERVKVDWTTVQRDFTDIDPMETEAIRAISGSLSHAYYGTIKIQQNVFGFFKVDKKGRVLDAVQVDNPPVIRFSKGMWLDVPKKAIQILQDKRLHVAAGIHAAEHAIMSLLPTFVISMPGDVRTECKVASKEFAKQETNRKRPARLTFYDAKGGAGGSGISTKAFDHVDQLLRDALQRVEGCHCERGCVECVASELCKHSNEVMSKAGSQVVLKSLLNMDIDVEALPIGPEMFTPAGIETVVVAQPVPYRPKEEVRDTGVMQGRRDGGRGDVDKSGESGESGVLSGGGFEKWAADSI
ncbi:hypothetical protein B0J13DRAFT_448863 [Dactylonectria estremocensis]|uniref:DEAD/DEAH box helicase n=1 Tax=Dactylonectria estremocensis TaxID=1079267 RepID=A0A9P9EHA4_9HYPO|nr:hypothetical protein B0J13DRAFT_448863 [Dactylonectria estremocensis]